MYHGWVYSDILGICDCHIGERMSIVNIEFRLTRVSTATSTFTSRSPTCALRISLLFKSPIDKALPTASATKPERIAKRVKRIVIELRIGELEVSSSASWVTRSYIYLLAKWSMHNID